MKIIRTKVMPMRVGRPVKIKATDETGKEYTALLAPVVVSDFEHRLAARLLCEVNKWPDIQFTSAPLNGNREWIHIEQVNTWVS
jgi:hypothetical protein